MTKGELLERIEMPREAQDVINRINESIESNEELRSIMTKAKDKFFQKEVIDSDIEFVAKEIGFNKWEVYLWFCIFCSDVTYQLMNEQGFYDDDFVMNLRDLTIWAKVCKRDHGVWGMFEFHWVARALRAELWRLGRLQFELEKFKQHSYDKHGVHIKRGDIVVNVHIPDDGPMPDNERQNSYKRACEFFGINVFVCDTYLLYPPVYEYLSPNSNIAHFMNEYDIITYGDNYEMKDMWRIFGPHDSWDLDSLPQDTSLQRAYVRYIKENGKVGQGYGVMVFDKNTDK